MNEIRHVAYVIPHTAITEETDFQMMLPGHVLHVQRMWLDEVTEEAEQKMVAEKLPMALRYLKGIAPCKCGVYGDPRQHKSSAAEAGADPAIPASADLCFFSCTNVRSAEVCDALSALVGKSFITSNQCVMDYIRALE